nr:hypothetical protein [Tanacetum cinerariifolium]
MSWFLRCLWCGGPFNGVNYRHYTNVRFRDEPVYDSNPNSYNHTPDFSNPPPHHNYEIDSRSDTGEAFQAKFAKFQQNFERFMAQLRCSNCGGLFNDGNYLSCSTVGSGNEFVHDLNSLPYDNTPDFSYQPPQHHVDTNSCELCGNDSHYGYDCPPCDELMIEQRNELLKGMQSMFEEYRQREQAANLSTLTPEPYRRLYSLYYDDDDDYDYEERTIPLSDIISQIPSSILITTFPPILPIEDPEVSLIMGNKKLNTILEKKLDKFIKSSVEDLVLIPKEKAVTFYNPLFNSNDDFTSSDDESLSDEDVSKENVKIYSNPLFEIDDEYISSDVNPLFDEMLENIECKDSYDSMLKSKIRIFQ